ncbi:TPA: hypothetical protein DEF17_04175 [bacterium]|nr:hypothetical protein [bacterium]
MKRICSSNWLFALLLTVILILPSYSSVTFYSSNPTVSYSSLTNSKKLDYQVMYFIKGAKYTLDVAVYNLTHPEITDSLIAAHKKGVRVRVVTDYNNWNKYCRKLVDNGIQAVKGQSATDRHMHHKFIIRDSNAVLTGSYNFTKNGARLDKNTIAVFKYANAMAELYTREFEQMFVGKKFGTYKTYMSARSGKRVTIGSKTKFDVTVYFSPEGGITDALVREIDKADTNIYFSMYTFTDKSISDAMLRAKSRGVKIYGAFDRDQNDNSSYSKFQTLKDARCYVRLDKLSAAYGGLLHDKIMVIDNGYTSDAIGIIGSFNFTNQADSINDENMVIIHRPTSARSLKTHVYNAYSKMSE